jgi:hypothetical protein
MTGAEPTTGLVIGTLFLALVASVFWPLTQHLITMTHEGSHAIVGSMTGGKIASMKMNMDGTGATNVRGSNVFLFALVGYAGPSLFGLLGATLLANSVDPDVILWVSLALLAVIFLQIRNVFGWVAVLVVGVFFFMVVHYGTQTGRMVFVYTVTWFLLLGGFMHTVQYNMKNLGWSADAGILRDATRLPRGLWGLLWWLATLAALIYGGGLLLGAIDPLLHFA